MARLTDDEWLFIALTLASVDAILTATIWVMFAEIRERNHVDRQADCVGRQKETWTGCISALCVPMHVPIRLLHTKNHHKASGRCRKGCTCTAGARWAEHNAA